MENYIIILLVYVAAMGFMGVLKHYIIDSK